jgi:acyl carrier protein
LTEVFQDVFDDETLEILPKMTAEDVAEWDSLSHIRLIVSAEQAFGLRFASSEISELDNVGQFMDLIATKLANVSTA